MITLKSPIFENRAYNLSDLIVGGTAKTTSFTAIIGHYYIVGASDIYSTADSGGISYTGCEVLYSFPVLKSNSGYSGGYSCSNATMAVIKATDTTVSYSSNLSTTGEYHNIHWVDLGEGLYKFEDWDFGYVNKGYLFTGEINKYYVIYSASLHGSYESAQVYCTGGSALKYTNPTRSQNYNANIYDDGSIAICKCTSTNFGWNIRNSAYHDGGYDNSLYICLQDFIQ